MIDAHCHLEYKDFDKDRDDVIERCRREMKAIVTSCVEIETWEKTLSIVEKHMGFVFAVAALHPEYVKQVSEDRKNDFLKVLEKNKDRLVGFGEIGLDFFWVKEDEWREKQKLWFREMVEFSLKHKKPMVVHSREAPQETFEILEGGGAKKVLWHLFGAADSTKRVQDNGWLISVGPMLLRSKKHKKIVKDLPLESICLETDSPFMGFGKRNEPLAIREVAEKIAEVKKTGFESVWRQCGENAKRFFSLKV